MIITVVMLLLLGMLEFGFVFDHHLTLEYATREGARVGAAVANSVGGVPVACTVAGTESVDKQIIAAVQRVITSPGSAVVASRIAEIKIYKADVNGDVDGGVPPSGTTFNKWVYSATIVAGVPVGNGPVVDTKPLLFIASGTTGWRACDRWNSAGFNPATGDTGAESIGVSLKYDYQLITPLSAAIGFFGPGSGPTTIPIGDRTVMALNPGK
jgi:TadE-like protein